MPSEPSVTIIVPAKLQEKRGNPRTELKLTARNDRNPGSASSDRFRFEWNVNVRETRMNPVDAYPGDDYVDVIGMDFYYNTRWNPTNPVKAWDEMVSSQYGLRWLEEFASAHKKPTAYPEWGINSDGAGPYIERAAQWFSNHNVLYQSVWNSNDAFPGKLTDQQYPEAASAYIKSFGAKTSEQGPR